MAVNNFWLISIHDSSLSASLVGFKDDHFSVISTGPANSWSSDSSKSFITAIDRSLSAAAQNVSLTQDQEPSSAAFILPPFWVSSDGKITPPKLEIIESSCKKLKLQPLGFIANDEAIAEATNIKDGFPSSFILLNANSSTITLSLIYMGKVKERLLKNYTGQFQPLIFTAMLSDIKDSSLPPQVIVFGTLADSVTSSLNSHSWIGQKADNAFLHIPEIKAYSRNKILNIYAQIIASQMDPKQINQPSSPPQNSDPVDDQLQEVEASELGFGQTDQDISSPPTPTPDPTVDTSTDHSLPPNNPPINPQTNIFPPQLPDKPTSPRFKIKLPKIRLPRLLPTKSKSILLIVLAAFPLLLLIPFLFSQAEISIFITPYSFDKQISVTLDSTATTLDIKNAIIPVQKSDFSLKSSTSTPSTGTKTIGKFAKGEIKIYNKQAKNQKIPKDTIITDSTGKKFQLANSVQIASSSSNLDEGIITLGQAKAVIIATEIGPEYNISADTDLSFTDFSTNLILAKTTEPLSGGSRDQVGAVSQADIDQLKKEINNIIENSIDQKIAQETDKLTHIIRQSAQTNHSRIDYSREIGEEADQVTASMTSTVIIFSLIDGQKEEIITSLLVDQDNFDNSDIDINDFDLIFDISQKTTNTATATLTINGQSLPTIDTDQLTQDISGKSHQQAIQIIKQTIPRTYDYNFKTNFSFLSSLNPLPFRTDKISIIIKSESL